MTISAGDWTVFFTRPLSLTIIVIALSLVVVPKIYSLARESKRRQSLAR
jgi:putative tricarboxylic transport membrane protein